MISFFFYLVTFNWNLVSFCFFFGWIWIVFNHCTSNFFFNICTYFKIICLYVFRHRSFFFQFERFFFIGIHIFLVHSLELSKRWFFFNSLFLKILSIQDFFWFYFNYFHCVIVLVVYLVDSFVFFSQYFKN